MRRLGWAICAVVLLGLVGSCASPEEKVAKSVLAMADAIQKEDIYKFAEHISYTYEDPYGQGRTDMIGSMQNAFETYEKIKLTVEHVQPTLNKSRTAATVSFAVLVEVTRPGKPTAETHDIAMKLRMVKQDGHWRVSSAEGDVRKPPPPTEAPQLKEPAQPEATAPESAVAPEGEAQGQ